MRPIILACLMLCIHATLLAQHSAPSTGEGPVSAGGIFGKVTDSAGKAIADASVIILKMKFNPGSQTYKGSLLKGVTTKSNGEFSLEDIPLSQPFQLKISAAGFKPTTEFITLKQGDLIKDLGKIKLSAAIQQLTEVTVTGSQNLLKMEIGKLSFNVEKNMITAGGTALDVMKYIPAVQTDIDGNVKLRNAAPQLFVDGRPTTLSLDQIPADAIETVEVITDPSAKYDASGNAGILNIILKKNRKPGYNANLRASVDRRGAMTGGGDGNIRQGKINISLAFNGSQFKNYTKGSTSQFNGFAIPHQQIEQQNSSVANGGVTFVKLGLDYFATNRTTFSMNAIRANWSFNPEDIIDADITADGIKTYASRISNTRRWFSPTGMQFGMKHLFSKQGREITADATYFSGKNAVTSFFLTDSMNDDRTIFTTEQQMLAGAGMNKFLTVQTDFITPVGKSSKFESGIRASIKEMQNANETSIQINNGGFIKVPGAGSNFRNEDKVYALYAVFTKSMKNIGYQLGLRTESADYTGTVLATGDKFRYKYPLSLFPSVFLRKTLKNNQQLQLNYTRRVSRPAFFQVIPFTDRTDPLNYSRGNPELKPAFTHSFSTSYHMAFKNRNSVLFSAYYKTTDDLITRFQQKEYDPVAGKEILVNTYINAVSSYNYGFELISVTAIKKWWDLTASIDTYNSAINTSNITATSQKALWSWFGKINNTFKLPKNYIIQLSGNFQSKSKLPIGATGGDGHFSQSQMAAQGYIKPFYGVDLSVRKSFLKHNAASVTLNFTDIFRSRWQHQYSANSYFTQNYSRLRDPQMVRLNLSYRFGKADMSVFKRKNMKGESEGMQGAVQGVGQ